MYPLPVDLEWPRRAIVGAIAVIGVTGLASFAEGLSALYFGEKEGTLERSISRHIEEKSDDCAIIDSPSNTGLSLVNSICEAVTTQMRLQNKQARREVRSG